MVSETDVEFGVVRKYFAFQVGCCCLANFVQPVVGRPQLLKVYGMQECSACLAISMLVGSSVCPALCCVLLVLFAFLNITCTTLLLHMHLESLQTCGCLGMLLSSNESAKHVNNDKDDAHTELNI